MKCAVEVGVGHDVEKIYFLHRGIPLLLCIIVPFVSHRIHRSQ